MGTWSYELDGSDAAQDYLIDIEYSLMKFINPEVDDIRDFDEDPLTPEEKAVIQKAVDSGQWEFPDDDYYVTSMSALVAIKMMEMGLEIPTGYKSNILDELESISKTSEYPEEREHALILHQELTNYQNQPTYAGGKGLLSAISKHIEEGKPGLVNKFRN